MDIERINEHTVKFYVSYGDIEERGFNREDIWYNREKSEELFWEMMDEVHHEEDFVPEGPLWIQVQALDKGLEILVTKAVSPQQGMTEIPENKDENKEESIYEHIEDFLGMQQNDIEDKDGTKVYQYMFEFTDIEDLLSLSHRPGLQHVKTQLYHYKHKYYLFVDFPDLYYQGDREAIADVISIISEYAPRSGSTIYWLQEYGKQVLDKHVFYRLRKYF